MKRTALILVGSVLVLAFAAAAFAQSTDPASSDKNAPAGGQAPAASTTPAPDASATPATPAPSASTDAGANVQASTPPASNPAIDKVKEKGMKASAKDRADVEKKLDEIEKGIETEATSKGEAEVAGRIAAEFGITADALVAERSQYGRGFGELTVAHTLMANAKTDATLADLFTMRTMGMGWGQIAAGLNLRLGEVVSAVKAEQRVAMGLDKADGKPAVIAAGAGASTRVKANAKPSTMADVKASAAGAGVGSGVDINKATGK